MIKQLTSKLSKDIHFTELLKGSSVAFVFKIIGMGLGYIFTLLIARWYGADTLGFYALSFTLLNILVTIGILGFDNGLVKLVAEYNSNNKPDLIKEIYQKTLSITMPLSILLSLLLFFSSEAIAIYIFNNEKLSLFFKLVSMSVLPFVLLKTNTAMFRGLKKIKKFSLYEHVLIFLLAIILFGILYIVSDQQEITIISYGMAIAITSIYSFSALNKHISKNTLQNRVLKYKDLLKISFPMLLTSSMGLVMLWTDIIMLGVFRSEGEVGVYSVLVKLAGLTSITLMAINTIAAPKFSEFYSKEDMEGLKKTAQNSTKIIFYSSIPIILIISLFPEFILGIFGESFMVGVNALMILMAGQFVNAISGSVGFILIMTGKQVLYNKIIMFASLLNIVLNYVLIDKYGMVGAAISTMISVSVLNILSCLFVRYYYGFYSFSLRKIIWQ